MLLFGADGCQVQQTVTNRRIIEHQALIDFSGLRSPEVIESLRASCSVPSTWQALPRQETALYVHEQWKSPSTHTGVGVAYIRMPIPLSENAILWLAKKEYTNKSTDGREIAQWTDAVGRRWFEAENNKYHVQGYVIARGFSAWVVYFGYKTAYPPDFAEMSLAARAAEMVVPEFRAPPSPALNPTLSATADTD
jgi:hypothetical protein